MYLREWIDQLVSSQLISPNMSLHWKEENWLGSVKISKQARCDVNGFKRSAEWEYEGKYLLNNSSVNIYFLNTSYIFIITLVDVVGNFHKAPNFLRFSMIQAKICMHILQDSFMQHGKIP